MSLWAVGVCLPILAVACIVMGIITLISGNGTITLLFLSGSLILAGLSMLYYVSVKPITKGMAFLTAKTTKLIKNAFISKENINE